jgi:gliding motility-associated-like protein
MKLFFISILFLVIVFAGSSKLLAQNGNEISVKGTNEKSEVTGVLDDPVANFTFKNLCATDTTFFTNRSFLPNNNLQYYLWKFGDGTETYAKDPIHIYTKAGDYQVELIVFTKDFQFVSNKQSVKISPPPLVAFTYNPGTTIYENERVLIKAVGNFAEIKWNTGSTDPEISVNKRGRFSVIATSDNGCVTKDTTASIVIVANSETDSLSIVMENNILTPNGDGKNEYLIVKGLATGDFAYEVELLIYNVWGGKVYESKNYDNSFDGTSLDPGTYYYHVRSKGKKGKTGFFDLIK